MRKYILHEHTSWEYALKCRGWHGHTIVHVPPPPENRHDPVHLLLNKLTGDELNIVLEGHYDLDLRIHDCMIKRVNVGMASDQYIATYPTITVQVSESVVALSGIAYTPNYDATIIPALQVMEKANVYVSAGSRVKVSELLAKRFSFYLYSGTELELTSGAFQVDDFNWYGGTLKCRGYMYVTNYFQNPRRSAIAGGLETDHDGVIVYKSFGAYQRWPARWNLEEGGVLEEPVDASNESCAVGINVCPSACAVVRVDNGAHQRVVWKARIPWRWLESVVFPDQDGKPALTKFRTPMLELIEPGVIVRGSLYDFDGCTWEPLDDDRKRIYYAQLAKKHAELDVFGQPVAFFGSDGTMLYDLDGILEQDRKLSKEVQEDDCTD